MQIRKCWKTQFTELRRQQQNDSNYRISEKTARIVNKKLFAKHNQFARAKKVLNRKTWRSNKVINRLVNLSIKYENEGAKKKTRKMKNTEMKNGFFRKREKKSEKCRPAGRQQINDVYPILWNSNIKLRWKIHSSHRVRYCSKAKKCSPSTP